MSFLGLSQNVLPVPPQVNEVELHGIKFFYHCDTKVYKTEHYQLYIVGHCHFEPDDAIDVEQAIAQAVGTYCYVLATENKLIIGTDAMGFYPLYYSTIDGFKFANLIPHLKHRINKPQINWDAWDQILNDSDIVGDQTSIKGILRLREGETIHWCHGDISFAQTTVYQAVEQQDAKQYIENNNALLKESMSYLAASEHNLIPLTGGHDSRRIVQMAQHNKLDFTSVTQETADIGDLDIDSHVAEQVAKKLNIQHRKLPLPDRDSVYFNRALKDYWCGFESDQHEWAVNICNNIDDKSLIFDGILGGVIVNNHSFHQVKYNLSQQDNQAALAQGICRPSMFKLKPNLLSQSREQRIKEELSRYPTDCNQITLFKIFNHTRRNIGHWFDMLLLNGHQMALPYAYVPFFNQSLALNPSERDSALFQRECMAALDPELAQLASTRDNLAVEFWQESGAPKVTRHPSYFPDDLLPIPDSVFNYFDWGFKERTLDKFCYRWMPDAQLSKRAWRYAPLQRLTLFLKWLATDESELPLLFNDTPPFIIQAIKPK